MEAVVESRKTECVEGWSGFVKKGSLVWFQGKLRVDWVELGYMSQRICLYDWDVKCVVGLFE